MDKQLMISMLCDLEREIMENLDILTTYRDEQGYAYTQPKNEAVIIQLEKIKKEVEKWTSV